MQQSTNLQHLSTLALLACLAHFRSKDIGLSFAVSIYPFRQALLAGPCLSLRPPSQYGKKFAI